jgi:hypothetical protein
MGRGKPPASATESSFDEDSISGVWHASRLGATTLSAWPMPARAFPAEFKCEPMRARLADTDTTSSSDVADTKPRSQPGAWGDRAMARRGMALW